ncbi:MAG: sigma-70 family RNA polymerase sigma factor [Oscillospiraceae bacterium]|nr:sigma-70 family RNA polymerase sigma factor [Oscillospiraceae bacterium]MBQ9110560.1 sigma-70 family RNA polymerase sigma factor [Oscillospiraceae bacterium]
MKQENTALTAFRKYGDLVLRTAYCCTGNYSEAEDITQDVFLALHENHTEFRDEEHMKAYLLRAAVNRGKNYRKSWRQNKRVEMEDVPELSHEEAAYQDSGLKALVLSLPKQYAAVLYLHYYEGYTIKEIAAILGKRENTIGSQLRRGREKLRLELEGEA